MKFRLSKRLLFDSRLPYERILTETSRGLVPLHFGRGGDDVHLRHQPTGE